MPAQQTIVLLGAPGTGATELAEAINRCLTGSTITARVLAVAADAPLLPAEISYTLHNAAITLLMGLDLPCPAPEQARREAFDARLRTLLADAAVRYHVVYGQGPRRTESASIAIKSIAKNTLPTSASDLLEQKPLRLRAWDCEKCSDPECEHRLFSALAGRSVASGVCRLTG